MLKNQLLLVLIFTTGLLSAQDISSLQTGSIVELESVQSKVSNTFVTASMERYDGKTRVLIHRSIDNAYSWNLVDSIIPYAENSEVPDPVVTCDDAGHFYLVVMRVRDTIPLDLLTVDLELYRSLDDGASWEFVNAPHASDGVADYPQLISKGEGELYLVYSYLPDFPFVDDSRLVFMKSVNGGLSWTPRHEFQTNNLSSIGPDIAWGPDEKIIVTTGNRNDNLIYSYTSEDFGNNWLDTPAFEIPNNETSHISKPVGNPALNSYSVLSHHAHEDNTPIVYHAYDGSLRISQVLGQGAYAQAYLTDDGKQHIIYNKKQGSNYTINYIVSEDNGLSFSSPIVLYSGEFNNSELGEYQSLVYGNDGLFYLSFCDWADNSSAKTLIFSPSISNTESEVGEELKVYPIPAYSDLQIEFPNGHKVETIRVFDLNGRLLKEVQPVTNSSQHLLDLSGLPPAMYLLQLMEENRYLVRKIIKR
ncbi:MAG: T9SS type A sorting domain-containing protein [Chitinophagales bacterium]|nr:T9SS type A sorting domain-containing protein [Chitinophagales bacterium]